jgi:WD40 repeat protein
MIPIGRVAADDESVGIAFPLTTRAAVTAAHVIRRHSDETLSFVPDGAPPVPVEGVRRHPTLDVVVLDLAADVPSFPGWRRAAKNMRWETEARWLDNDPLLTGKVDSERRALPRGDGTHVEMMQLLVEQEVGDYRGYSGSPVTDEKDRVIGVLVEQVLERKRVRDGSKSATNVLYAAPIEDVVEHFGLVSEFVPAAAAENLHRLKEQATAEPQSARWRNSAPYPHDAGKLVDKVAFSPDGTLLATAGSDRKLRVWSLADDDEFAPPLLHDDAIRRVVWSGDGALLATASGHTVSVWAAPSGLFDAPREWGGPSVASDLAVSPNGRLLAVARGTEASEVLDAETFNVTETLPPRLFGVAFSPDTRLLAAYGIRGEVHLWRLRGDGTLHRHIPLEAPGDVKRVTFSPSGRWLIVIVEDSHVSKLGLYTKVHTVWVYDPTNGNRRWSLPHDGEVEQIAMTRDDSLLASASLDHSARVWAVGSDADPVALPHSQIVVAVAFAGSGEFLVVSSLDKGAQVVYLDGESPPDALPHDGHVSDVTVSRDGLVATACGRSAYVWHPLAG